MSRLVCWIVCLVVVVQPGCAFILTGEYQDIPVNSSPEGATVHVDGGFGEAREAGTTPATIHVRRSDRPLHLRLVKEGREAGNITLVSELNPMTIGNAVLLLFGIIPGVVGFAIDVTTGAWREYRPRAVHLNLEPVAE